MAAGPRGLIVFSHANSFPAPTYRVLFAALRERGFAVEAVEKYGHDPRYPVTDNWPHLVQQLVDFAEPLVARRGQPAWLVGHSLGGFLSLMAAARAPQLARGVLLVDSPVLGGWRANALGMVKRTPLVGSVTPGRISRARRNSWPDAASALEHFRHKKAFAHWDPEVLRDYVAHGTHDAGEGAERRRVLSFDRDVETAIYNTLPDNLAGLLRRHPLKCPAAYLGGRQSAEMRQIGMALTARVVGADGQGDPGRVAMLDGSHLFPMERPLATAAAVESALLNMGA
ncbi:alpha/beta hydrolase [Pseudorhodoferax sp.]|uniref:alpha/beta hydrolase n=1 Tax=Pseudorhodoferax sp. TaxID=1993553 RepID=UPI0039E59534